MSCRNVRSYQRSQKSSVPQARYHEGPLPDSPPGEKLMVSGAFSFVLTRLVVAVASEAHNVFSLSQLPLLASVRRGEDWFRVAAVVNAIHTKIDFRLLQRLTQSRLDFPNIWLLERPLHRFKYSQPTTYLAASPLNVSNQPCSSTLTGETGGCYNAAR